MTISNVGNISPASAYYTSTVSNPSLRSRETIVMQELATEAERVGSTTSRVLKNVRGAAYMNDVGEGLKPAIGESLAKRFWYPALAYVGTSVFDKTFYNKEGEKDFSLARGGKELAFQTLASLCGPILLVNIGQNTIGEGLIGLGNVVKSCREGQNPFASMSGEKAWLATKEISKKTVKGVVSAAKELPHDIISTIKLAINDLSHPKETFEKMRTVFSKLKNVAEKSPEKMKKVYGNFKADKMKYIFGKNGILFGSKGLLGEKGLLLGSKSGKVLGGLLAILLLYKPVDKLAEKIVEIPEKILA